MVDRETDTSWSQVTGRAIDGQHKGAQLEKLEAIETSWQDWRKAHPETTLLKKGKEVLGSHYQSYFDDPEKMGLFRAQWLAERMPGKTLVYGASIGPHAVAVTEGALDDEVVVATLGDTPVVLARARDGGVRAFVARVEGEELGLGRNPKTGEVRDGGGSVVGPWFRSLHLRATLRFAPRKRCRHSGLLVRLVGLLSQHAGHRRVGTLNGALQTESRFGWWLRVNTEERRPPTHLDTRCKIQVPPTCLVLK